MEPTKKSNTTVNLTIGALALIGIIAIAFTNKSKQDQVATEPTNTVENSTTTDSTSTDVSTTSSYKDGTYSATGSYTSPGGPETVLVNITLTNGIVTDANVTSEAVNPKSKIMQGQFISGYKSLIIGKNINDINLTKVSGSSLTPKGFDDALAQIKQNAKS